MKTIEAVLSAPDFTRYVALFLLLECLAAFPYLCFLQGRRPSAWFAIASQEITFMALIALVAEHIGDRSLSWWPTPLVLVATGLMNAYFVMVVREVRADRRFRRLAAATPAVVEPERHFSHPRHDRRRAAARDLHAA